MQLELQPLSGLRLPLLAAIRHACRQILLFSAFSHQLMSQLQPQHLAVCHHGRLASPGARHRVSRRQRPPFLEEQRPSRHLGQAGDRLQAYPLHLLPDPDPAVLTHTLPLPVESCSASALC